MTANPGEIFLEPYSPSDEATWGWVKALFPEENRSSVTVAVAVVVAECANEPDEGSGRKYRPKKEYFL